MVCPMLMSRNWKVIYTEMTHQIFIHRFITNYTADNYVDRNLRAIIFDRRRLWFHNMPN